MVGSITSSIKYNNLNEGIAMATKINAMEFLNIIWGSVGAKPRLRGSILQWTLKLN